MIDKLKEPFDNLSRDEKAREALVAKLGPVFGDTFLTRKNRPKKMAYFDLYMSEVRGLRIAELHEARKAGRKVVSSFCSFVPEELIVALDAISVGICSGAEMGFDLAEKYVPASTCSLVKSLLGFKLSNNCPYMDAADMIVGENTCDGKKKTYEVFATLVDNFYVIDLPQKKSTAGKALFRSEFGDFASALEKLTGKKLDVENISRGIEVIAAKRKALSRLNDLRRADPSPISGLDALLINQLSATDDPTRFAARLNELCDELDERVKRGDGVAAKGAKRIVVAGCPMAAPNWKVPSLVESTGAVIVGEESCVGERSSRWLVEKKGTTVEALIDDITDRYFKIDCAIFTPNDERAAHIATMTDKYSADGVLHYSLQFCQPYQIEAGRVEVAMKAVGKPTLKIESNYGGDDKAQIKTRVDAFIEML